jgi:pimeloyl-ACP methyl ester carboxylesterase
LTRANRLLRSALRIAALLGLLYGGLLVVLSCFAIQLVYFPRREVRTTPAAVGLPYQALRLVTDDGVRVTAWYVPADAASDHAAESDIPRGATGARVVLFLHGNAGNIGDWVEQAQFLHGLGVSVLLLDYRGFGESAGAPSEEGTYADARAAWHYLTSVRGFAPADITVFGFSLGGGVATYLANEYHPGRLILAATFTSLHDVAARLYPWAPVSLVLHSLRYPSAERLGRVSCPVLVLHSADDELVPFALGQRLFALANEPKRFITLAGGHNETIEPSVKDYAQAVTAFIGN